MVLEKAIQRLFLAHEKKLRFICNNSAVTQFYYVNEIKS